MHRNSVFTEWQRIIMIKAFRYHSLLYNFVPGLER